MFGHLRAEPILRVGGCSVEQAVEILVTATNDAQPVRWIEFPAAVLLLVTVPGDPASGALYVLDRKDLALDRL